MRPNEPALIDEWHCGCSPVHSQHAPDCRVPPNAHLGSAGQAITLSSIGGFPHGAAGRMLRVMRKAALSRLFAISCVISTTAAAQSEPNNPQPAPGAVPGAATPSPSGWTAPTQPQPQQPQPQPQPQQPQPQPQPQQPNNTNYPPQQSGYPTAPANGNTQQPVAGGSAYATTSTRDANNNYQGNDNRESRAFSNEDPRNRTRNSNCP